MKKQTAIHKTYAAAKQDKTHLYIGFWGKHQKPLDQLWSHHEMDDTSAIG